MYSVRFSGIQCKISLLFPAVLLYLLYADPSGLLLFGFSAAVIHECGHIITACLLRHKPRELVISCFGMRLVDSDGCLSRSEDALIALAGPALNAGMYLLLYRLPIDPLYADIHLVMAVFNLLPIDPLDGGRVLDALVRGWGTSFGFGVKTFLFYAVWAVMTGVGIALARHPPHNITLCVVAMYLLFHRLFYNGN